MGRGLDRQLIFRDDQDRDDFTDRLAKLAETEAIGIYAWALLPNHFHLLVRTGKSPLARAMRSLLTGYAVVFNRRHRRSGHLFQNRYKSIVVEEETYLLELVRYLHLNPLRAGIVSSLRDLDRYPYSGHAALVGRRECRWQATEEVLGRFGTRVADARRKYRAFVAEGRMQGRRPELMGGGLVRSTGGWAAVRELRHGREHYASDERILGGTDFVLTVLQEVEKRDMSSRSHRERSLDVASLIARVANAEGMTPERIQGAGRPRDVSRVREGIAYLWVECLGGSGRALARELGLRPESVNRAARRGQAQAEHWRNILGT
jgi:REP element-mobilizing transposase RayT